MTRSLAVGLVGAGFMGAFHSRAYNALPRLYDDLPVRLNLAHVADIREEPARALAERWAVPRWSADWHSVIDDPGIDVVDICTPPGLHREIALAAMAAGKHVYCEKPVGRNAGETLEMVNAAAEAGVITFVGFNYRWMPAMSLARQLIADGRLGDVVHVRIAKHTDSAADPLREGWRFFASNAGFGSLGDVGSHVFDLARSLAGDFSSVSGLTRTVIAQRPNEGVLRAVDTDDFWLAMARFESGATGTFEGSRVSHGSKADFEVEVLGTGGAIRWSGRTMSELQLFEPATDGLDGFRTIRLGPQHPDHGHFVPVRGHLIGFADLKTIEIARLAMALAGTGPAVPGFRDALAVARVIEAVPLERWVSVIDGGAQEESGS